MEEIIDNIETGMLVFFILCIVVPISPFLLLFWLLGKLLSRWK